MWLKLLIITQEQGLRAFPKGLLAFKTDSLGEDRRRLPLNLLFLGLGQCTQGNFTDDAQNMFKSNFFLNFVFTCSVHQLCLTLCGPMDCILTDSSVHGLFQARLLEWVAISSSRESSWPGIDPVSLVSPAFAVGFFTTSATWECTKAGASASEYFTYS